MKEWVAFFLPFVVTLVCAGLVYRTGRRANRTEERTVDLAEFRAAMEWKQEQLDQLRAELVRQDAKCQDELAGVRRAHEAGMSTMHEQLEQVKAVAAMDFAAQVAPPLLEMMQVRAPEFAERIATALRSSAVPRGQAFTPTDNTD